MNKKRRNSLAVIIWSLLLTVSLCVSVSAKIPSPSEDFYVYDEADVIPKDVTEHIVNQNELLYYSTGAQIVIAAVNTTGDEQIRNFACNMFNEWQIGDDEKNNGVLVLLAIEDDDYWVTQGSGIESTLSSGDIKVMIDDCLEPYFAIKDYANGVKTFFDRLISTFEDIYDVDLSEIVITDDNGSPSQGSESSGILSAFLTVLLIVVVLAVFFIIIRLRPLRSRRPIIMIPPMGGRPPFGSSGPHHHPSGHGGFRTPGPSGSRPGGSRPGGSRPSSPRPSAPRPSAPRSSAPRSHSGGGGTSRGGGAGRR